VSLSLPLHFPFREAEVSHEDFQDWIRLSYILFHNLRMLDRVFAQCLEMHKLASHLFGLQCLDHSNMLTFVALRACQVVSFLFDLVGKL
jgi:hypothetical protein